jgi:Flp pilus assembly pilin Flp
MLSWIRNRMSRRRKGQAMVELALILCLIAVVVLVALTQVGNELVLDFEDVQAAVQNPSDPGGTTPYTCPNGSTAVLHGHKYHCY